ncbi:hypothetical protein BDN71DRAFT_1429536 [Pleurotus eryngii]|uniref:Uncharacterized protein n=1 Tax=Pleurotus eryngii TaxID=5323 RepID=A0A9P6DI56_PLEER|nr:hypothetical protein BDN71DRAFT_1429536 [Pleurotus eryngii]
MSDASSHPPTPPPNLPEDAVATRAEAFEDLVLTCVEGKFSIIDLVDKLTLAGTTPVEANDFVQQAQQRTMDETDAEAHALDQQHRQEAVDALSWNLLRAKVASASSLVALSPHMNLLSGYAKQLADLIGVSSSPQQNRTIPSSVLNAAPHLTKLATNLSDPLLEATWKLCKAYTTDKAIDSIIDLLQCQHMHKPITQSIWREIIQDKYVNFEKLYISILPGYDHRDEAKEFVSGYAIIKKDNINVHWPLSDKADWIHVFSAWKAAVIMLDAEVRECYARSPFCLDNCLKMDMPLLHLYASIGTSATVQTRAQISVGMAYALSVERSTELGTLMNASPPSVQANSELEEVRNQVVEAQVGPRRFEVEK